MNRFTLGKEFIFLKFLFFVVLLACMFWIFPQERVWQQDQQDQEEGSTGSTVFLQDYLKEYEGKTIREIRYEGLSETSENFVQGNIQLEEGGVFLYEDLRRNFQNLNEIGFFERISIEGHLEEEQLVLTFFFVELPKVETLVIQGEKRVKDREIISVMRIKSGNVYREEDLLKDQESILKLYREKGFEEAVVQIRSREGGPTKEVNVIVEISEGTKSFIESIRIIGTREIDPDDLYAVMRTKESTLLRKGQPLDEFKLLEDQKRMEQFLKNKGYWQGRVQFVRRSRGVVYFGEQKDPEEGFSVLIEVEEGPQFTMGDLSFRGNRLFKIEEFGKLIQMETGEIYRDDLFQQDLQRIRELYYNRGYVQLSLIPNYRADEENSRLNIDVELVEGEQVHVRRIRIRGNEKTRNWVIDRELRIFEGELFNFEKVQNSVNRIRRTQFFGSVFPNTIPTEEDALVDLDFNVVEQRTGTISFGFSYGFLTGFSVFEEIVERNFLGTGWKLRHRGEFGERILSVEVGTSTFWLLPYVPVTFDTSFRFFQGTQSAVFSLDSNFVESGKNYTYKYQSFDLDFTFGYFLIDFLQIFTGYAFTFSRAYSISNFSLENVDNNSFRGLALYRDLEAGLGGKYLTKISQNLGVSFDNRDLPLNTRKGMRIRGIWTYTGGIYSGDSHWIKWNNDFSFYFNPFWQIVFASFFSYEVLFNQFGGEFEIRDVDRLRFNGISELRGWRTLATDDVVSEGGKIALSQEIRFPIFTEILWGVLFMDAGDVSRKRPSFPDHIHYYSLGFGFRFNIAFFPLRFYFAKKADYNVSQRNKFYFHPGFEVVFTAGGSF